MKGCRQTRNSMPTLTGVHKTPILRSSLPNSYSRNFNSNKNSLVVDNSLVYGNSQYIAHREIDNNRDAASSPLLLNSIMNHPSMLNNCNNSSDTTESLSNDDNSKSTLFTNSMDDSTHNNKMSMLAKQNLQGIYYCWGFDSILALYVPKCDFIILFKMRNLSVFFIYSLEIILNVYFVSFFVVVVYSSKIEIRFIWYDSKYNLYFD